MPDCLRCAHCETVNRGAAREHQCDFTGAEVSSRECGLDWPCALQLPLATRDDRTLARTVLVLALRRGKAEALLLAYGEAYREKLIELFTAEGLEGAVHAQGVDEVTAQRRWAEALTAGAARV
jgi:hypothetical protein